jgi:hypothetical protein
MLRVVDGMNEIDGLECDRWVGLRRREQRNDERDQDTQASHAHNDADQSGISNRANVSKLITRLHQPLNRLIA